jgi:hypothetical protein
MSQLTEFKCPLCGTPLASDECYHANGDLEERMEETYDEQTRNDRLEYERRLSQFEEKRVTEVETLRECFGEQTLR